MLNKLITEAEHPPSDVINNTHQEQSNDIPSMNSNTTLTFFNGTNKDKDEEVTLQSSPQKIPNIQNN
jgi:hypothetical protein